MLDVILRRFEQPDEVRTFEKGKFEVIHIGGMTIGRATYSPGWKWSEHVGLVISGRATAVIENGPVVEMKAGDIFYVPPGPPSHDSWVVGDEPYVSLHLLGAIDYSSHSTSAKK